LCLLHVLQLAGVTEKRRQLEEQVEELQAAQASMQSANATLQARLEAAEQAEASLSARCESLEAERDAACADFRASSDELGRLK
jgi:chromosome segregation ATPase